ncbi:acyl-CoA dehydrogenase [Algoriphagus halophytocola]|uniref:Acyl-CoA dehydrogenase n=1 Tax=Algoriphagus halophytocola TaxID=2991499 RepID=A0ABY6MH01_9BACT|nr:MULTISPECIES: acyl-CoA dehydrogenase [unclassified Algoriphagus]UZD23063.1 acyl-CoA dehydrogenase [Algoriphagus sp. TR-M5]WBL44355.1 acyl-CoA dehydrogenase [Algoriphagus sp. TR-M9]
MQEKVRFDDQEARKAGNLGRLPEDWLQEVFRQKWFKLFVPKELGGLQYDLPQALKLEEKLASMDGSLGWTVTLCAGAGWFVGFVEEQARADIFRDPKLCLAGSGFVGGKANLVGYTYELTGRWTYASGALHASHLTANCEILENGQPLLDEDQKPIVKAFILDKQDVKILDGWNYMGMIATGSHAFEVKGLKVSSTRCFEIIPSAAKLPHPIYQYPFLQFAETTLAANILGIATHLQSLIIQSFWKRHEYRKYDDKHLSHFKEKYLAEIRKMEKAKTEFYRAVEKSWQELQREGSISEKKLKNVSKKSRKLTQRCRLSNAKLYPFAGLEAAKTHSELNRVWRDFNTVSQHALLIFPF